MEKDIPRPDRATRHHRRNADIPRITVPEQQENIANPQEPGEQSEGPTGPAVDAHAIAKPDPNATSDLA